jgi:hypothetical protein
LATKTRRRERDSSGVFSARAGVRGHFHLIVLLWLSLAAVACREPPSPPPAPNLTVWQSLGSWKGRGLVQTGPFIGNSGTIRLRWETANESSPGAGTFKVTVHSDVSGRSLLVAVDHKGAGADTTYVYEDPRAFFLVVESADLDWTLTAEEPVAASAAAPGKR